MWQRLHSSPHGDTFPHVGQIDLEHVSKEFGEGEVRAVDDVSLTIADGVRIVRLKLST